MIPVLKIQIWNFTSTNWIDCLEIVLAIEVWDLFACFDVSPGGELTFHPIPCEREKYLASMMVFRPWWNFTVFTSQLLLNKDVTELREAPMTFEHVLFVGIQLLWTTLNVIDPHGVRTGQPRSQAGLHHRGSQGCRHSHYQVAITPPPGNLQ